MTQNQPPIATTSQQSARAEPAPEPARPAPRASDPALPPSAQLPSITTTLTPAEVLDRLRTASKRGRLPGFVAPGARCDFTIEAHGNPFDAIVAAHAAPGEVRFELRPLYKMPAIFVVVMLATIWPGVHLMDSLIPGEWNWIDTWIWYLPLTVLPLPWVCKQAIDRARRTTRASALASIDSIAAEIGGAVTPPASKSK